VLETHNLRGGDGSPHDLERSLARLLDHLRAQTRPLASLRELAITHTGLTPAAAARLEAHAGRSVRFVELPPEADYYAAKNAGFAATTADVVAFADADCWPDAGWLEALLAPFAAGAAVEAVAGRTLYREGLFGAAATAIDFMYFPSPLGEGCTRNFYANNVAFRRDLFARMGYGRHPLYRGSCQVLGLALQEAGVAVRFAAEARTVHRLPDSTRELLRLRFLRGGDALALAPHLARAYLPRRLRWLGSLGLASAVLVLGARWLASVRALGRQDLAAARGLPRVAGVALPRRRSPRRPGDVVLSYHRDVDRLAAAQ
jgi:GT2 family glycosyltransferase